MQLFAFHGEVVGLSGTGVPSTANLALEGVTSAAGQLRIAQDNVPQGPWTYRSRKDANGNGGTYVLANINTTVPGTMVFDLSHMSHNATKTATELWLRIPFLWPTTLVGDTYIYFKDPTGVYTHAYLKLKASTGVIEMYVGSVLRGVAGGALTSNNDSWVVLSIHILISSSGFGEFGVWLDYDYAAPLISYYGTVYSGTGAPSAVVGEMAITLSAGGFALDDVKIQDASLLYTRGYPATQPSAYGESISVYLNDGSFATATITATTTGLTSAGFLLGGTSNGGRLFSGVVGPRTPGSADFSLDGTLANIAADIASAINDPANGVTFIASAVASASTVTLTATVQGTARQSIPVSILTAGLAGTPFSGGVNGTYLGNMRLHDISTGSASDGNMSLYEIYSPSMAWNGDISADPFSANATLYSSTSGWTASISTPGRGLEADSGRVPDGFFGPALLATGAGSRTELTPSAGPNFGNVNVELGVAADSSSNATAVAGAGDLYVLANTALITADVASITQVAVYARVQKDNNILNSVKLLVKSGGVQGATGAIALPSGYATKAGSFTSDPSTGAGWTLASVNLLETGAEFS